MIIKKVFIIIIIAITVFSVISLNYSVNAATPVNVNERIIKAFRNVFTKLLVTVQEATGQKVNVNTIKFVNIAKNHLGDSYKEFNASSDWCLYFVNYCFKEAEINPKGFDIYEGSCSAQVKYLENTKNGVGKNIFKDAATYIPEKGDIFFIRNDDGDGYVARHTGIVTKVEKNGKTAIIYTIEGNVNGDKKVAESRRYKTSEVAEKKYKLNTTSSGKYETCLMDDKGNLIKNNGTILGYYNTREYVN